MIHPRWLQNKSLRKVALTSSVLCLSLVFCSVALSYSPRNPTKPKGATGSGGSRGDCKATEQPTSVIKSSLASRPPLTLLAPQSHIGQTGSNRPTFVWFMPEQDPHPVELTLFEYSQEKGRGQLIHQPIPLKSLPGVMHLSLLETQIELSVGKTYVWQVALICSRNSPAKNPWMQAVVEVVEPPSGLQSALAATIDPLKRAELYLQAGFWYEALAETLKTPTAKPFRQTLLTDLGKLESPEQRSRLEAVMASEEKQNP